MRANSFCSAVIPFRVSMARMFVRNKAYRPERRWKVMERLLSRPTVSTDLYRLGPEPWDAPRPPPTDAVDR